jgi:hypothetical protein
MSGVAMPATLIFALETVGSLVRVPVLSFSEPFPVGLEGASWTRKRVPVMVRSAESGASKAKTYSFPPEKVKVPVAEPMVMSSPPPTDSLDPR